VGGKIEKIGEGGKSHFSFQWEGKRANDIIHFRERCSGWRG